MLTNFNSQQHKVTLFNYIVKAKCSTLVILAICSFLIGYVSRYNLSLSSRATERIANTVSGNSDSKGWSTNSLGKYAVEYVESIVHPAMLAHPNPSNILIVGGAKEDVDVQAILTEVLRHKSVESVHVVESLVTKTPAEVDDGSVTCNSSDSEETTVEYLESLESILHRKQRNKFNFDSHSTFDIVILLHPYDLFSDIRTHKHVEDEVYFMGLLSTIPSAMQTLSQELIMSPNGVLVTHLGPSPYLNRRSVMAPKYFSHNNYYRTKHLQLKLIAYMTSDKNFDDVHVFEDAYGPGSMRMPQSYAVFCRQWDCNHQWYADEAFLNHEIRRRLSSPTSYIDSSILRRYNRPPKAWESLYCSFPEHERLCKYLNGYDPEVPNIPRESFEVRTSSIGRHVGRGLFTKVDIAEGSYFMQEVSVHQVKFTAHSVSKILATKKLLCTLYNESIDTDTTRIGSFDVVRGTHEAESEIDSVITYMEGYGYDDDLLGSGGNCVDSGMNTFMNHGCNKTFNYGHLFYVFDRKAGIKDSEYGYLMLSEEEADPDKPTLDTEITQDLFNPLKSRHLEHLQSSYEGVISSVSEGQELFCNYVFFSNNDTWKFNVLDLRSQCRGEKVGTIVQLEGM